MKDHYITLYNLKSLNRESIEILKRLGVANLHDLLAHPAFRNARQVRAARDKILRKEEVMMFVIDSFQNEKLDKILESPADSLKSVSAKAAELFHRLGIKTVDDLANYAPFAEAEEMISNTINDETDPYAPSCVLPKCKKFSRNSKSFISFFKQKEIRGKSVRSSDTDTSPFADLLRFNPDETSVIYLGYSVSFLQEWIYNGVHLGEPQGSVNLFMGQDTQVSVLDWRKAISATRSEKTGVSERLSSTLFHQRAVDEVARATAEEHQHGATSAFGANAATAGSFVVAGAVVGGIGGGISGALAGLVLGNVANAAAGAPTIGGAIAGTAIGSIAGAAAGSLVFSGATTLGFVESDADGERDIFARSAQNIQQRTIQNSSSIRSFWSNIISQNVQEEQQTIRTDRVTNHNRIHALNAIYFEILNEYKVNILANDASPILFLPFKPFLFDRQILRRFWWLIRNMLSDKKMVSALDEHFLSPANNSNPAFELRDLPRIEEVIVEKIEVEVNLDGSLMESILGAILYPVFAAVFVADAAKRENIKVSIVTSDGTIELQRDNSPNLDPNFVGKYSTRSRVQLVNLQKIKITNSNPEFKVMEFDLTELAFENIAVNIKIANKADLRLRGNLNNLSALETKQPVIDKMKLGANKSREIDWNIASQLRDQFAGITTERDELKAELSSEEIIQAKISELLGFLNANKFGFTRLILQNTEREQLLSVLEGVKIDGQDLTSFAFTTPLGFSGNHILLPLKKCQVASEKQGTIGFDTTKLEIALQELLKIDRTNRPDFFLKCASLSRFLRDFNTVILAQGNGSARERALIELILELQLHISVIGELEGGGSTVNPQTAIDNVIQSVNSIVIFLAEPASKQVPVDSNLFCNYYTKVKASLNAQLGKIISSDEISLPSPAVFMEPVLSNAKGAELYDMRRNSHYDIFPAPGIGIADPNINRSQDLQLIPNSPSSNLSIQSAPEFALPNSIQTALTEAGKLDLSTIINTNAATLQGVITNLASLAGELAKASASLTGDAQKQVVGAAADVSKQISDIVGKSLNPSTSKTPEAGRNTVNETAPSLPPPPPRSPQEKAETGREQRRIDESKATARQKDEQKRTLGIPVVAKTELNYRMGIAFLDAEGGTYTTGSYIARTAFFGTGDDVLLNGGVPVDIDAEDILFQNVFALEPGRRVTLTLDSDIADIRTRGTRSFILPDNPDIFIKVQMKFHQEEIEAANGKTAVTEVMKKLDIGVTGDLLLKEFLNNALKFPFKLFEINSTTGQEAGLDIKAEVQGGGSTTGTTTTTNGTLRKFKVVVPTNVWDITINPAE